MRTVTSMRGRPSSASEIASRSTTRRDASSQTGRTPSSASTSAMSSPEVRIAEVPHTESPTDCGQLAVVGAVALEQRIRQRHTGFPGQPGRHRLGVDGVEVASGGQHVDQTAQRRTRRPGRDETAVERAQDLVDLAVGLAQPRHDLGGREPQHRGDVGVVGDPVDGRRRPSRSPAAPRPARAPAPRRRRRRRGRRCRPRPGRAPDAGPAPTARRRTTGGPAGWPAPGRARLDPSGAWPRMCRPSRIWTSLISHSQPSTCSSMSSNDVLVGPVLQPEVVVHLRGPHQRPDLLPDRGQLAGVQRGDVGVLVEQLLEPGDVAVGLGTRHRRDQVVDQHGVGPALGLGALPGIVDQERVDQRQVAERGVGAARRGHAQRLAGQPLQVAVLAEVHDGVGAETVVDPATGTPPDSGGWAADPGRGRSRPGSRRIRAAAGPASRRCPTALPR